MSTRLFQSVIHQMRDAIERTVGIVDTDSVIIACSELGMIGNSVELLVTENQPVDEVFIRNGYTYKAFGAEGKAEYYMFVEGTDAEALRYVSLMAVSMENLKHYYDEKLDRANFVKNVILDNILASDIYVKARELHFNTELSHVVLIVKLITKNDVAVYDVIQNLFPDKQKDFVINISQTEIAIVKEIKNDIGAKDLENLARSIVDTLSSEFYLHAVVSIGTVVEGVKDLARSFKEAQVALEVGKVFDTEKTIISYDNLGIARLIYQLPTTLCETFLREVFKRGSIESLDQETLFTIQKFFENNLNVSETSRKLFVHRNTLVYRLEKIRKLTGLDLREFEHAIVFKIALMVKKYLNASPIKY